MPPDRSGPVAALPTEAVIVCCHAIFHGEDPYNEAHWALQPFQKSSGQKPGEHLTFLEHIRSAIAYRSQSEGPAQLIFSGGITNPSFPDLSEARSYLRAARDLQLLRNDDDDDDEVLLEELATDSYQNVLFSIIKFRKLHGYYPSRIVVVTHDFKVARFADLHIKAIRWPAEQRHLLGVPLPLQIPQEELAAIRAAEQRSGYSLWAKDLYGTGLQLSTKRKQRRWKDGSLQVVAEGLEPSVQQLLFWPGGENGTSLFPHDLPWTSISQTSADNLRL